MTPRLLPASSGSPAPRTATSRRRKLPPRPRCPHEHRVHSQQLSAHLRIEVVPSRHLCAPRLPPLPLTDFRVRRSNTDISLNITDGPRRTTSSPPGYRLTEGTTRSPSGRWQPRGQHLELEATANPIKAAARRSRLVNDAPKDSHHEPKVPSRCRTVLRCLQKHRMTSCAAEIEVVPTHMGLGVATDAVPHPGHAATGSSLTMIDSP